MKEIGIYKRTSDNYNKYGVAIREGIKWEFVKFQESESAVEYCYKKVEEWKKFGIEWDYLDKKKRRPKA